jgi:prevent-host-death family protein
MKYRTSTVGVRELRQNLSVYLRRVAKGEKLEVTERRRAVAVLAPVDHTRTAIERLVAAGRAIPAKGDLLDLPAPRGRPTRRASRALQRVRADRL